MKNPRFFKIFDDLTNNQKSSLISHIKIFTKKYSKYSVDDIWSKFTEEENYLYKIKQQKLIWINDFWNKADFEKSVKFIINTEKQKIYIKEKNKIYYNQHKDNIKTWENKKRQWRQSKEKPTSKQIAYYKSLCKKSNIETIDLSCLSKLDLINMIANLTVKKKAADNEL